MNSIIESPNSSGQGYCSDHALSPFHAIAEEYGYRYSHSTPIHRQNGTVYVWHTYTHGKHTIGFSETAWNTSCGTHSGRHETGIVPAFLARHLASKRKRYPELRS